MSTLKSVRVASMAASFLLSTSLCVNAFAKERSPIRYEYEPGEITKLCDQAMERATQDINAIAQRSAQDRTFQNTVMAFENITANLSDTVLPLTFMNYVSTDPKLGAEAAACEEKIGQYSVALYSRKDVYLALKSQKSRGPKSERLLTQTLQVFEDNGLNLPDEQLKQLIEVRKTLSKKETQFSTNLNKDESRIEVSVEELAGVPEDFIKSLETSGNNKVLPMKEPVYVRIMENATNPETRRKMLVAFENRAFSENTSLIEEAIVLRQKIAAMMGYKNWADYRVHNRMAKNSETILTFLEGLKQKLSERNKEDLAKLLKLKKEMEPGSTELKPWDIRFYTNQLAKKELSLDKEKVREYFPADLVISGMFKVYSKLLGVNFVEQKEAKVWADGVKLYQIQNTKTHELIGYFYADFFPRKGKYGHAAAFPLISGRMINGSYSHPVASIVANFSAPENGKPSLLPHEEVDTLFHEFGHIMHQTLTRAPYASLSGSSVDQDFVEAPSQMLENWVFAPEILDMVSGHYLDHSKKLPPELLQKLIESRDFMQGYRYTRQLLFGLLDMSFHTVSGPVNTKKVYDQLFKELVGIDAPEQGHFVASFGHLMGGYDAGYYGYLWSEVYAADMFTRFEKSGLLSSEVGGDYRRIILESGKMRDANDLLTEFLGRKPNTEAFYKKLHIK